MTKILLLVVATWGLTGCVTMQHRAEQAMEHGAYLDAAGLYERIAADNPKDPVAKKNLQLARDKSLAVMLADAQAKRAHLDNDGALLAVGTMLDQRNVWKIDFAPEIAAPAAEEIRAGSAWVVDHFSAETAQAGPLSSERDVARYARLLATPEFAAASSEIHHAINAQGISTCSTLSQGAAGAPYTGWLLSEYCGHWGAPAPAQRALPHQRSTIQVDGTLDGASASEVAQFSSAVSNGFRASVWFASDAPQGATAKIAGSFGAGFSSEQVSLSAPWTESIPYVRSESYEEEYQEPYTDTETYYESVPYTDTETCYVPCDTGTCPQTQTVTKYRDEARTRTVTKYRTAYRTETRLVNDVRYEPRVFTYNAVEQDADYSAHVSAVFPAPFSASAQVDNQYSDSGYDHDVTFAPAGVAPQRAYLASRSEYLRSEADSVAAEVTRTLDARYRATSCALQSYTLEDAATCAYAGKTASLPGVVEGLRTAFGDDAPLVGGVLGR